MKIIENEEIDINLNINTDGEGSDELEPLEGEEPLEGDVSEDYQYVITIEEVSGETTDAPEAMVPDGERQYEFILKPFTGEEEMEDEFDEMQDVEAGMETEAPMEDPMAAPTTPMPLESKESQKVLEAIDPTTGQPMEDPMATDPMADPNMGAELEPLDDTELTPEEEITDETYTFTQDELTDFFNTLETNTELYLDEETKFDIEEVIDYLKLYPESEMMVKTLDPEMFDAKLKEIKEGEQDDLDAAGEELQTVEIGGENADGQAGAEGGMTGSQPGAGSTDFPMESFSILNVKNKKNLPDGVYIAALNEGKVYGRFTEIKVMKNNIKLGEK